MRCKNHKFFLEVQKDQNNTFWTLNRIINFNSKFIFLLFFLLNFLNSNATNKENKSQMLVGAERFEVYLDSLKDKKVGLIINHTSLVNNRLLVDTLLDLGINIVMIFSPEHGFKGQHDAGEKVENQNFYRHIPLVSLYGKKKKPSVEDLRNVDILIFDIQDVGVRFYTYISTMHFSMEAAAESNKPFIVLDRPNPNRHYIAGPVLDTANHRSFIGIHPIPIVYGLTIGELATMINGESWLQNGIKCKLWIVTCKNYNAKKKYSLPVPPSPNLPNDLSIALYPSLALFEGTVVSVGRGTDKPFQIIGMPDYPIKTFSFVPKPNLGAKYPKHLNITCFGKILEADKYVVKGFFIDELVHFYEKSLSKSNFFNPYFNKLAGNFELKIQIEKNIPIQKIYESWLPSLKNYKMKRKKYLLYSDFYK